MDLYTVFLLFVFFLKPQMYMKPIHWKIVWDFSLNSTSIKMIMHWYTQA